MSLLHSTLGRFNTSDDLFPELGDFGNSAAKSAAQEEPRNDEENIDLPTENVDDDGDENEEENANDKGDTFEIAKEQDNMMAVNKKKKKESNREDIVLSKRNRNAMKQFQT